MRRRHLVFVAVALVAALAVVNATVFAIRTLHGQVKIVEASGTTKSDVTQYGAACAGFYTWDGSSGTVTGDAGLPKAGTNANATAAGSIPGSWYGVEVVWGDKACEWTNNTLYASATVYINVSQGHWYFKDILGFGYPSGFTPSPIYVTPKVSTLLDDPNIASAKLIIYKNDGSTVTRVLTVDLKSGSVLTGSTPITLNAGEGLQLDLELEASGAVSLDEFTVDFYVSSSSESPR